MELGLEARSLGFFQELPSMPEFDRSFGITQVQEVALDGIAVDIQGFRRLDDVPFIENEPMEEVMAAQVVREKSLLPKLRQDRKAPIPFRFGCTGRDLEGQGGLP